MPIAVMIEFEREHQVDDDDLDDHPEERADMRALLLVRLSRLDFAVDFVGGLADQEQSAADQNDVAPGEFQVFHRQHRLRQPDQPDQEAKQKDAEHQGQQQPDLPRAFCLRLRNPRHDDRQEDDVVDAEHDLQRRQCQQRRPSFRTGEEFDHAFAHTLDVLISRIAELLPTM